MRFANGIKRHIFVRLSSAVSGRHSSDKKNQFGGMIDISVIRIINLEELFQW